MIINSAFMLQRLLTVVFIFSLTAGAVLAQNPSDQTAAGPQIVEILGISVEGTNDDYSQSFIRQTSGLEIGQRLTIPGDPALSDAIRAIHRLGTYEDVRIVEERSVGTGIYLAIRVQPAPSLKEYRFTGIKKGHAKDIRKESPLVTRGPVRSSAISRTEQVIKEFYEEKGRPLSTVNVERIENEDNTITLDFQIEPGPKVEIEEILTEPPLYEPRVHFAPGHKLTGEYVSLYDQLEGRRKRRSRKAG